MEKRMRHQAPIKEWDPADRPRERMLNSNPQMLSNAELLSIIIGTGCGEMSALDIAKAILLQFNLHQMTKKSPKELCKKFKGIGEAKAVSILAALELGKRSFSEKTLPKEQIRSSSDAFQFFYPEIAESPYEIFKILLLSRSNRVIRSIKISEGGISGTLVDPKKIFKYAIDENCCNMILAHNHPSGSLLPSKEDICLTQKIKEAGNLLDIHVIDHLILSGLHYYSFADEGHL